MKKFGLKFIILLWGINISFAQVYNPEIFFDQLFNGEIMDKTTIGSWDQASVDWHYRFVETCIEHEGTRRTRSIVSLLDLGSGAGHWINYFAKKYPKTQITGTDISKNAIDHLQNRFLKNENITILQMDLRDEFIFLKGEFDIINGIGLFHHIINDSIWTECLKQCAEHLETDGILFVGSRFDRTENFGKPVYRRFRSLEMWQEAIRAAGLQIKVIYFTNPKPGIKRHSDVMVVVK